MRECLERTEFAARGRYATEMATRATATFRNRDEAIVDIVG